MGDLLSSQETLVLYIIAHVSSVLSILGSIFIILSYLCFRKLRKANGGLIFWLSVCDFFSSLAYFVIPVAYGSDYCYAQGFIIQFFQIASFVWTASIALALYIVIVLNKSVGIGFLIKYLHLVAWAFASIDVGIGAWLHMFGDANYEQPGSHPSWCWIKSDMNLEKFLLYFLPFTIVWIFNAIVYIIVSRRIHKVVKSEELRGRAFRRMRLYLLVFMLCIGVGAINRLQNFLAPGNPIFVLNVFDATLSPLQGFLNSVVYGMNKQLRRAWGNVICCRSPTEQENEPILSEGGTYGTYSSYNISIEKNLIN